HCRVAWDATDESRAYTYNSMQNSGYANWKWAVERQVSDYMESFDYPMIRYAEVLLNYAEAAYELDNAISDEDLDKSLNLVRLRVNPKMPKLSNTLVSANGLSMREEIRRERTVELFLEGFRLDDLKRWATAPIEMSQDLEGVLITGTEYETRWTGRTGALSKNGCVLMYTDRSAWQLDPKLYLLPVPVDQLQLNPAMGQTPGW
ncbi:MAG: RagB/SusD family nutrient uptake outer membrane protein, partial [Muribaculaceae bacterium]|nr:RagB/SusD family nutrient uptake outer membrane protein [Muribaculaceae bacterium]